MLDWLRKLRGLESQLIHPPWRTGQYVTYFLDRDDGLWTAIALRLLGQTKDGAWAMSGDFKTAMSESTTWFLCDPNAAPDRPAVTPARQEVIRKPADEEVHPLQDSLMAVPLALNLLMVRRWPRAAQSLRGPALDARYPCGVDRVHLLVTDAPGYKKHHHLNPRVMLTGVACLSVDGDRNPMTATSFGLNHPSASDPTDYEDFVDLSHAQHVAHDGFSLSYPATWFLRVQPAEDQRDLACNDYLAVAGGNTCAASLFVSLYSGSAAEIARQHDATLSRLRGPMELPFGRLVPRESEPLRPRSDAQAFVFFMEGDGIEQLVYSLVSSSDRGDRLAHVRAIGTIARANPRREATFADMEPVLRSILESFQFA